MRIERAVFLCAMFLVASVAVFSQREIPKDLEITLYRSECFGWCPSYSLTILGDGTSRFMPLGKFVYISKGEEPVYPFEGKIVSDQLRVLLSEFEKIRFNSMDRRYGSSNYKRSVNCPQVATDASSAEVTFVKGRKRKSVSHYLGCSGSKILKDLTALENKIDEVANSKQWISKFGWGTGNVFDLNLQINPGRPKIPKKPGN